MFILLMENILSAGERSFVSQIEEKYEDIISSKLGKDIYRGKDLLTEDYCYYLSKLDTGEIRNWDKMSFSKKMQERVENCAYFTQDEKEIIYYHGDNNYEKITRNMKWVFIEYDSKRFKNQYEKLLETGKISLEYRFDLKKG